MNADETVPAKLSRTWLSSPELSAESPVCTGVVFSGINACIIEYLILSLWVKLGLDFASMRTPLQNSELRRNRAGEIIYT